ncbi:hypothetical protein BMS3Abin01_00003 [bacterium BMS3Abin01]|nr:hypothetical protein BMS3Abin01_00003 [bacterium BMS3Abin01]
MAFISSPDQNIQEFVPWRLSLLRWHQIQAVLSDQLPRPVAEQLLGRGIGVVDQAIVVEGDDPVRGHLREQPVAFFAVPHAQLHPLACQRLHDGGDQMFYGLTILLIVAALLVGQRHQSHGGVVAYEGHAQETVDPRVSLGHAYAVRVFGGVVDNHRAAGGDYALPQTTQLHVGQHEHGLTAFAHTAGVPAGIRQGDGVQPALLVQFAQEAEVAAGQRLWHLQAG